MKFCPKAPKRIRPNASKPAAPRRAPRARSSAPGDDAPAELVVSPLAKKITRKTMLPAMLHFLAQPPPAAL